MTRDTLEEKQLFEILSRWDYISIPEEDTSDLDSLFNLFKVYSIGAFVINPKKTERVSENAGAILFHVLRGSYFVGIEFGSKYKRTFSGVDLDNEIRKLLSLVLKPAKNIFEGLIEISHAPGRIVLFKEDKEQCKREAEKGLWNIAIKCFVAGSKYLTKQPEVNQVPDRSIIDRELY
jgi:hypothetical protein